MKKRFSVPLLRACAWFCGGISLAAVFAFAFRQEAPVFAIGLEKMNVLYAGVDNPLSIVVQGVPDEQVRIETQGISLQKQGEHLYNARITTMGSAAIIVSGGDLPPTNFTFRTKAFPDPGVYLGSKSGGKMGVGEFRAQYGIYAPILNMDIDANCEMISYQLTRISGTNDPVTRQNIGARYNPEVYKLVEQVTSGDTYIFEDIKVRCPGDVHSRQLGSMVFKIK
ncbi:MAG TPA: GldM family protein [Saprospiraceae bacterium]|nr:GldM family protein [Saprospiraceae bacterium]HPI09153.1 GldM family protein [Saprospiraceae bacterium]